MSIDQLAHQLHDVFAASKKAYAVQDNDGYKTKYARLSPYTIRRMLQNKLSIMTYQMVNMSDVKWLCLDFDMPNQVIGEGAEPKKDLLKDLLQVVKGACVQLDALSISYLVEFSGNRGFHIWIILDRYISKAFGYEINTKIMELIDITEPFSVDLFPTTAKISKEGIGKGVKLPCSCHVKSGCYSFLISNVYEADTINIYKNELNNTFIDSQISILNDLKRQNPKEIMNALGLSEQLVDRRSYDKFIKTSSITVTGDDEVSIDSVLNDLSGCSFLKAILKNYRLGLTEKERVIIVGLLSKIQSDNDPFFGNKLLEELFSRMPNYRPELTRKKLECLKLQPVTCEYLRHFRSDEKCSCLDGTKKSPIEHIRGVAIADNDPFAYEPMETEKVITAASKYTYQNDEVAMPTVLLKLEDMKGNNLEAVWHSVLHEVRPLKKFYTFRRQEEDKVRILITLTAKEKVLTKLAIKALHAFYYPGFSDCSYGYRFNYSLSNNNLFYPWLQQWNIFTKEIKNIVDDENAESMYVVKLDIKGFYSNIDREMLRIKLVDGPTDEIRVAFKSLGETEIDKIKVLASWFISICDATVEGKKGVPQGPAFARYLAELYLMDFDRFIERMVSGSLGRYFRYVDDVFVFVDTEAEAASILAYATNFLKSLGLHLSHGKCFVGTIAQYKPEISRYFSRAKYVVDHAKLQTDHSGKITNAITTLFSLLRNDGDGGQINESNLPFFLTHLSQHRLVHERLVKLEEYVLRMNRGRGSLFRNFFKRYIETTTNSLRHVDDLQALTGGLKREVFISSILSKIISGGDVSAYKNELRGVLTKYAMSQDLTVVEKELLGVIMLHDQDICDVEFLSKISPTLLSEIMQVPIAKNIPPAVVPYIAARIVGLEATDFLRSAYSMVRTTKLENVVAYRELGATFLKKFINDMGANQPTDYKFEFIQSVDDAQKFHHLLAFFTVIVEDVEVTFEAIINVWHAFMYFLNNRQLDYGKKLDQDSWLVEWDKIELLPGKVTSLLTLSLTDGFVKGYNCELRLYEAFYKNIVILMVVNEPSNGISIMEGISSPLAEVLERDKRLYLKWIIEGGKTVQPYPNKAVCISNILINDRLVLRKGNDYLVRVRRLDHVSESLLSETGMVIHEEGQWDPGYQTFTFNFNAKKQTIEEILNGANSVLATVSELIKLKFGIESSCQRCFGSDAESYSSTGQFDEYISDSLSPLVPLALCDNHIFDITYKKVVSNSINGFLEIVFENMVTVNKPMYNLRYPFNFSSKDIVKKLVPPKLRSDKNAMLQYLKQMYIDKTMSYDDNNPYEVERAKISGIIRYKIGRKEIITSTDISGILYDYHSLFEHKDEKHKLLLKVTDIKISPDITSFIDIYKTIIVSINSFYSMAQDTDTIPKLPDLLFNDLTRIVVTVNGFIENGFDALPIAYNEGFLLKEALPLDLTWLNQCDITADKINVTFGIDETISFGAITLSADEASNLVMVMALGGKSIELSKFEIDTVELMISNQCFLAKHENELLVIVMSSSVMRTFEAISARALALSRTNEWELGHSRECYYNTFDVQDELYKSRSFNDALENLMSHLQCKDKSLMFSRIAEWLRLFNPEDQKVLVEVIAAHRCISDEDITKFLRFLDDNASTPGVVIGSLKTSADFGGLYRLLADAAYPHARKLQLDSWPSRLIDRSLSIEELVVLNDVFISGNQVISALEKYYFLNHDPILAQDKNYHMIPGDNSLAFIEVVKNLKRITFFAAVCTETAQNEIKQFVEKWYKQEVGVIPEIIVDAALIIDIKSVQLDNNPNILTKYQGRFREMITKEKMSAIFEFNDDIPLKFYNDHKIPDTKNLLIRIKSVPKRVFKIFVLQPKDKSVKPLFNCIFEP
ncbi:reverse transcriptase domain-containing protein [Pelobacter propionicus]|uniref:Reverse transcriptase domain-containing protein n=1 Tax=Pelobacter propionicus (strain DSM 2379 / NBRC 103807 / OttBd1) TaxID=338966 RepID=A1AMQ8_PELPD|nr:reverse transcriptase domain-containing protein [Pelobacter propionicus]ABK98628.1 hypothetical protein Ppro_1001 [Pelobacter propionicus DSM 2379]